MIRTKLPAGPFMGLMNTFGYTFGRIFFVWIRISRTVKSQGFILKTTHLLRSTQPFSISKKKNLGLDSKFGTKKKKKIS